jgi:hypothetical protein
MPVILVAWETEIGMTVVQNQSRQIVLETIISKITRAKWTGGMAEEVEHLFWKCEALSSNCFKVPL